MSKTILITGAAGYIASHFCEFLCENESTVLKGSRLVFLDDLSSGSEGVVARLTKLANERGFQVEPFHKTNLLDTDGVSKLFGQVKPNLVMHFAAKISVAESVEKPDFYFENNVVGSKNLLDAMKSVGCKRMVFSSTAAVYGKIEDPVQEKKPIPENAVLKPINPYGKTKLMMEEVIAEASKTWGLDAVIFRYFNAAGASLNGTFGECHEPETHLIPLVVRAAIQGKPCQVFGTQYETRDGSCVRDYVHVSDLASAHLLGLERLLNRDQSGVETYNLGTERGTTVLEVLDAAEVVSGKKVQRNFHPNRAGDSAVLVADSANARKVLGWSPKHSNMNTILKSVFQWEQAHSHSK